MPSGCLTASAAIQTPTAAVTATPELRKRADISTANATVASCGARLSSTPMA